MVSINLGHAGAVSNDNLIIFGGRNLSSRLNDVYALNLISHEWTRISAGYQPDFNEIIGTGLMSDRDGSVCDTDGVEYPEGRSLHSFTRYSY